MSKVSGNWNSLLKWGWQAGKITEVVSRRLLIADPLTADVCRWTGCPSSPSSWWTLVSTTIELSWSPGCLFWGRWMVLQAHLTQSSWAVVVHVSWWCIGVLLYTLLYSLYHSQIFEMLILNSSPGLGLVEHHVPQRILYNPRCLHRRAGTPAGVMCPRPVPISWTFQEIQLRLPQGDWPGVPGLCWSSCLCSDTGLNPKCYF